MRLLILASAATLVLTGTAMAGDSIQSPVKGTHHHHHHLDANASIAGDSIPADTLSAHETRIQNLRDSGYNPADDFTSAGNVKVN